MSIGGTDMQRKRALTKYELALPLHADLKDDQTSVFVIQSCNSPGSAEHPQWSTLYWWVYGPCLNAFKEHSQRIGRSDEAPKFKRLEAAQAAFKVIKEANLGNLRSRIIVRTESCIDVLIEGEGK